MNVNLSTNKSILIRTEIIPWMLAGVMVIIFLMSLNVGRYAIPLHAIISNILTTHPFAHHSAADKEWVVIELVRMPRVLAVLLCGMGLGMAGAVMQSVFRNPLVGPEVIGVSSGASLGGVIAILFSFGALATVSCAFLMGMTSLLIVFFLTRQVKQNNILALVLAGVIISGLFNALTGLSQYFADPQTQLPSITYWLLGSFAGVTYEKLALLSAVTLICCSVLLLLRWRINLLSLGDLDALTLGLNVNVLRWSVITLTSLLVTTQVSVSGGVGFVGLIVPHMARIMVGPEHSRLLPASTFLGGIYLLVMDDVARSLAPQEIPIGLITSLIGAPVFAFLFLKVQSKGWSDE